MNSFSIVVTVPCQYTDELVYVVPILLAAGPFCNAVHTRLSLLIVTLIVVLAVVTHTDFAGPFLWAHTALAMLLTASSLSSLCWFTTSINGNTRCLQNAITSSTSSVIVQLKVWRTR